MKKGQRDLKDSDFPDGMGQPALRALNGAGYHRLEQLTVLSESEVKRLHGIGPKALDQLRRAMAARGLSFANEQSRTGK